MNINSNQSEFHNNHSQFDYSVGSFFFCHIKGMLKLCNALETIADTLPNQVDRQLCRNVARLISPVVDAAHTFEENVLFPVLEPQIQANKALAQTVRRLKDEHHEDEDFAHEISESLERLSYGQEVDTGQLSYMLRGFFEGMRRHIACEKEFIFPLIEQEENRLKVQA